MVPSYARFPARQSEFAEQSRPTTNDRSDGDTAEANMKAADLVNNHEALLD